MTTMLQKIQEQKALAAAAAQALAGKQSAQELSTTISTDARDYAHLVAGATTILPDGKRITFYGKKGNNGFYSTRNEGEIEWLESLCEMPGSQVTRVIDEQIVAKEVDPAILQAALDAAANTESTMNPAIAALQANFGATIAKTASVQ